MACAKEAQRISTWRSSVSFFLGAWLALQPCGLGLPAAFTVALFGAAQAGLTAEVSVGLGVGRFQTSVQSLHERRWKNVVRQSLDISCGSAALATILRYHFGDKVSEKSLIQAILKNVTKEQVRSRGGFSLLDMKLVATARGYQVQGFKLSLKDLKKLRRPAIVPVTIRGFKHFIVFRGMANDRVVLADPAFGNTTLSASRFQSIWQGVALVISKKGQKKRFSSRLKVLSDEALAAENPSTIRFLERITVNSVTDFDEF